MLAFLAALTASDAKNPLYQPGTLIRAKIIKSKIVTNCMIIGFC
jgi:hypothetical protein